MAANDKEFKVKNGLIVANSLIYAPLGQPNVGINTTDISQATLTVNGGFLVANGVLGIKIGNSTVNTTINSTFVGTQGFTGSRGFTGSIGFTGSQGNLGFTGSQGAGFTGSQGVTGFIGSPGSPGGFAGSPGPQGATGFTGSQGSVGFTGSTGNQGTTGTTGFTGSQGGTGSQGSVGFTGSKGDAGSAGSAGSTGFTGSKGDTGSQGTQGTTGFTGSQGNQGTTGFTGSFSTGTMSLTATAQVYSGGVRITSFNNGVQAASTTLTPDPGNGPLQYATANGAFTIAAPANDGLFNMLLINGAGAGVITFSGFNTAANTGDSYNTTNGNKFMLSIARVNGTSTYLMKALQ